MKKKPIESMVADEILQRKLEFKIGDVVYEAPAPTIGTLVMVSELIAQLPEMTDVDTVQAVLSNGKHGRKIARVIATYIIGAKELNMGRNRRFLGFLPIRTTHNTPKERVEKLAERILVECTAEDISRMLSALTSESKLSDFFAVTTFLREASLTKPTKVEKTKTTASGRS